MKTLIQISKKMCFVGFNENCVKGVVMSNLIPGYKRHSIDEFSTDAKRLRTNDKLPLNENGKKTRGRVKIDIEVCPSN